MGWGEWGGKEGGRTKERILLCGLQVRPRTSPSNAGIRHSRACLGNPQQLGCVYVCSMCPGVYYVSWGVCFSLCGGRVCVCVCVVCVSGVCVCVSIRGTEGSPARCGGLDKRLMTPASFMRSQRSAGGWSPPGRTDTHTDTHTHRHADTQTCRHTDMQTHCINKPLSTYI